MNNKLRLERWGRKMMQFQRETREGLGAFGVSVIRAEDVSSLAQSKDRNAIAFTSAVIKWQAMIEGGTWQLCLACDYKFRSAKIARAFLFIQPICEEPTTVMLVGICEECSKKDDEELLEIAIKAVGKWALQRRKWRLVEPE